MAGGGIKWWNGGGPRKEQRDGETLGGKVCGGDAKEIHSGWWRKKKTGRLSGGVEGGEVEKKKKEKTKEGGRKGREG